jgi:5-methylcytosine-specific restriction endonuclease McrA
LKRSHMKRSTKPIKQRGERQRRFDAPDRDARTICKQRAGEFCEICGEVGKEVHHMICRDDMEFRWNQANLVYLCVFCHKDFDKPGGRPRMWSWFRKNRPADFEIIGHRSREVTHVEG